MSADLAAKIDPIFASYADQTVKTPGCAVGVYRAGEILFAKGYGFASLEFGVPITPATVFEIGSMSKQFTATAILLLAQDGKLSLDDDVRKYVPELPDYGHPITLRHLLHHTGGLRAYDSLLEISGYSHAGLATTDEELRLLTRQKGVDFAPGKEWSYSNTGYLLLSFVVARASGKPFAAFMKERIFDPLGMKDTFVLDDHTRVVPRRATPYGAKPEGGFEIDAINWEQPGAGNVQSTILDLARWDANFYEPKVGGKTWLEAVRTPGKLDDGSPIDYAMGLVVISVDGRAEERHGGKCGGYNGDGWRWPAQRLSVVYLCNRDADPPHRTELIVNAILPKGAKPADAPAPPPSNVPAVPSTRASDLTAFAGAYMDVDTLMILTLAMKDGSLQLNIPNSPDDPGPPHSLGMLDARSFRVTDFPVSVWTFHPAAGKTPARLVRTAPGVAGNMPSTFERYESQRKLDPAKLAAYVGRYTSDEVTRDLEVSVVDGKLFAQPWGKSRAHPLEPLARDAFEGEGPGLVFGRDTKGRVSEVVAVLDRRRSVRWTRR